MAFRARKVFGFFEKRATGLDLFPVIRDSTLPPLKIANWLPPASPVGVLNNVSVKFELFLSYC